MIFFAEELDFDNLTSEKVHQLVPERPLGEFSWDNPVRLLPLFDHDLNSFRKAIKGFYQRLCILRCAQNTRHAPTDAQIESYTIYLLDSQRDAPELKFGHGSWAIPEDTRMPSDAAVDFAYVPSYLAVAWLVLVKDRYPNIANNIAGLDKAIHRGFKFIFQHELRGHGYDSNRELLKAVEYLALGATFSFIEKNQDRYSRYIGKIRAIESRIIGKLSKAEGYSATDSYGRQRALQLIRGGDKDDSLVCPPVWHQWQLSQSAWAYNQVLEIAPSIAARAIFPSVKEKAVEVVQRLREAFLEVKPKHAVFGQRRQVTSDPIELKLDLSFDSSIESAIGQVGVVPWVDHLSPQGFMRALNQSFMSRLSYELNRHFAETEEFKGEEFNVYVAKVQRQSEQYRIFVSARG